MDARLLKIMCVGFVVRHVPTHQPRPCGSSKLKVETFGEVLELPRQLREQRRHSAEGPAHHGSAGARAVCPRTRAGVPRPDAVSLELTFQVRCDLAVRDTDRDVIGVQVVLPLS